jgi:predicted CXXCH cytochrome family protein
MLVAAFWSPVIAVGGEWHRQSSLVCTDCHSMHNSQSNQAMRYDSSPIAAARLLRAGSSISLCLACHAGATSLAPNVRAPSNFDPPGGGFPADLTDPDHVAHALGTDPVLPPEGDTPVVMTCVTCHDPHGNGVYRNLRPNPSGNPGRAGVTPTVQQATVANGSNPGFVYTRGNVLYLSTMSQWCMTCHNLVDGGGHTLAHPHDRAIWGATQADYTTWAGTFANRVPVQNALGQRAPDHADQVFCLSCHKAHGSPNPGAMIYADGDQTSTCQQCHP